MTKPHASDADDEPLVMFAPPLRLAILSVTCWAMTLLFAWAFWQCGLPRLDFAENEMRDFVARLGATAAFGLFLCCAVGFSFLLVSRRPTLVVDAAGVHGLAVWTEIRWDDIAEVSHVVYAGERYVGITLRDREAFLANKSWWLRTAVRNDFNTGLPHFCVLERLLPRSAADVVDCLRRRLERRRSG